MTCNVPSLTIVPCDMKFRSMLPAATPGSLVLRPAAMLLSSVPPAARPLTAPATVASPLAVAVTSSAAAGALAMLLTLMSLGDTEPFWRTAPKSIGLAVLSRGSAGLMVTVPVTVIVSACSAPL